MLQEYLQTKISTSLDLLKTEEAIFFIKDTFGKRLSRTLNLVNVSAPIAVLDGTGINDDLNGVEKPISFSIKGIKDQNAVIVQSLAKWKRVRLKEFNFEAGRGLLTDMRAVRPDEVLSPIHSIYVDQWDWEKHILPGQRNLKFLKRTVESIYEELKATERDLFEKYPEFPPVLPEKIYFIHAEELLKEFPAFTPKQREAEIARIFGAVFIIGIGANLSNGEPHDGRAPDYDDWSTINEDGYIGLNGDIILWNPVIERGFELSSMGIRVNEESMLRQLKIRGCSDRKKLLFHRMLLNNELPLSIGGGIGQSRVCMFLLKKSHIGEVQSSIWPESTRGQSENGLNLL
ncbi:MAG: aspartate--ammonia ligase [Bacteroidales bacterium]|jgi:aspartate--ammonia ligase|nr:aspartate--ammonia ligase [Bacteroidales bacterium]